MSKKVNDVDYISTPDRRKTRRLCHVNILKPYKEKGLALDKGVHPMLTVALGIQTSEKEVHSNDDMTGD